MTERQDHSNALHVRMFGNFQLYYDGRPLTKQRLRDTHFTMLLQILLHNASTGVSRENLEDMLFGDREIENRQQALQTIVYKAKKQLKAMGLPDEKYIFSKKGIFYWTPQIPVVEDAAQFDALCRQAEACEDKERQLKLRLEACYQYRGEFLSAYAAVLWAGAEARRYRMLFGGCVENAAAVLREREDWKRLEELGRHAVKTAPFSDWDSLVMEALTEQGRYEDAAKFYTDTVDNYLDEQGAYPAPKFMEMMEKLGDRMQHSHAVLDLVKMRLRENTDSASGGYLCSYPMFRGIYRMTTRRMDRGGQSVYLMLCRLVDGKGNPMKEGKRLRELTEKLGEAIRISVRRGDAINCYGNGQFLVLLINITRENCAVVESRINREFLTEGQRISVEYHVVEV